MADKTKKKKPIVLDLNTLSGLEVAEIESTVGIPLAKLGHPAEPNQARLAVALYWIARRRNGETGLTFDEAGAAPFGEIDAMEIVGEVGGAVDPTDAATS